MNSPGILLYETIKAVGLSPSSGCQCNQRITQMNVWGWRGCWENRATVAAWLTDEAAKLNIPVEPTPQAVFAKGMQLVAEKGVQIPERVLDEMAKAADADPELAADVRKEVESWLPWWQRIGIKLVGWDWLLNRMKQANSPTSSPADKVQ